MKLVTYLAPSGGPRLGAVMNERVYDLAGMAQAHGAGLPTTMQEFLSLGEGGMERAHGLCQRAESAGWPSSALNEVQLLAPLPRPNKVLALAGNFQEHIQEAGHAAVNKARVTPRPFIMPSTVIVGPQQPIILPRTSQTIDWELELLIVIGRAGKNIRVDDALSHVAGYSIFNDISARSLNIAQGRDARDGDGFFDWLLGKWLDTFGPMGPYIVTPDEVGDPHALAMRLYVNDQLKQNGSTAQMIFNVPELVAFLSEFITLEPGDVIATGTPSGVGATTNTYLQAGDVVRGEIDKLGVLVNPVQSETAAR